MPKYNAEPINLHSVKSFRHGIWPCSLTSPEWMIDTKQTLTSSRPGDWKRILGQPRVTWMRTVQNDVDCYKHGLKQSTLLTTDRPLWGCWWLVALCSRRGACWSWLLRTSVLISYHIPSTPVCESTVNLLTEFHLKMTIKTVYMRVCVWFMDWTCRWQKRIICLEYTL